MDIESIKAKYLTDDFVSKMKNARMHAYKRHGYSSTKERENRDVLSDYIHEANSKLGGLSGIVQIYGKSSASGSVPTLGVNWKSQGTVSVPEAQLFIKKLQQAIKVIQNAPKAPTRG